MEIGKSEIGEFLEIGEFSGIGKILEIENARPRKKETARAFASKREIPSEKSTLVGLKKCTINMYKFGQISISSKDFNREYQVQKYVDLEKIRVSEGVVANRCDTRYIVGYEVKPGVIVPLYIKTPKDCFSSGVSRYNDSSPWKMGFNVGENEAWVQQYEGIFWRVCEILHAPGCGGFELGGTLTGEPLNNGYVNAKLLTWDGQIQTGFQGTSQNPEEIGTCHATGILKIASVYRQGSNYYLQVFLKECKYQERDVIFKSLLSSDDESDSGYDTIY